MLTRSEFWLKIIIMVMIFVFVVTLASGVDVIRVVDSNGDFVRFSIFNAENYAQIVSLFTTIWSHLLGRLLLGGLATIYAILIIIWSAHRFIDVGLRWYYIVVGLIPYIGPVIFLLMLFMPSDSFES